MRRAEILALALLVAASGWLFGGLVASRAAEKPIVVARNNNFHPLRPLFRLFSSQPRENNATKRDTRRTTRPAGRSGQRSVRTRSRPAPAAPVAVPKDPDASVVLVIGDSLARGLGRGLEVAFADTPKISVRLWANGSSGLVRDDFFDWPTELRKFLAGEERVDMVVVMLGVNDRQSIRVKEGRLAPRTEEWETTYKARVVDLLKALAEAKKPAIWVGLPPTKSNVFSADMAHFNDLFKAETEAAGVSFIDIRQRFVDEEGRYTRYGPDVEGRKTTLRASDDIHFTGAGYRKLAFYVEKDLRRVLGTGSPALVLDQMTPDGPMRPKIGAVLPLTGPIARAEDPLAGSQAPRAPAEDSVQYKVIVKGEALPVTAGRADNFAWPRKP